MDKLKDLIEESLNNISLDNNIKSQILDMDVNESIKRKNARNKRTNIRAVCKKMVIVAACLVMLVSITSVGTYALSGKTIFEVFFKDGESEYAKELLDYNGQSYNIDDYTITLEQTLYDSKTYIGYCVFSITKKSGKPEAKINRFLQTPGSKYGENDRFCIQNVGSQSCKFEYIGDTLYEYFSFRVDDEFDMIIRVMDLLDEGKDGESRVYEYHITESEKYKEFRVSDTRSIFISPLGIAIHSIGGFRDVVITLHYQDDTQKTVVDTENNIGIGLSSESNHDFTDYLYQFVFEKIVDVNEIDYITFNGERVESVN